MGLTMTEAALTGLASWVLIQLFRRSLGRPIYALGRYIQRGASGTPMSFSMSDLYEGNLNREDFSATLSDGASVRQYASLPARQYAGAPAGETESIPVPAGTTTDAPTHPVTHDGGRHAVGK
jgi:hypothetical protein